MKSHAHTDEKERHRHAHTQTNKYTATNVRTHTIQDTLEYPLCTSYASLLFMSPRKPFSTSILNCTKREKDTYIETKDTHTNKQREGEREREQERECVCDREREMNFCELNETYTMCTMFSVDPADLVEF